MRCSDCSAEAVTSRTRCARCLAAASRRNVALQRRRRQARLCIGCGCDTAGWSRCKACQQRRAEQKRRARARAGRQMPVWPAQRRDAEDGEGAKDR